MMIYVVAEWLKSCDFLSLIYPTLVSVSTYHYDITLEGSAKAKEHVFKLLNLFDLPSDVLVRCMNNYSLLLILLRLLSSPPQSLERQRLVNVNQRSRTTLQGTL